MLQLLSDCRQPRQIPRHAQCVKLLRQCLNEVGLEAEVTLPPRAPKQQPSVQQQFPSLARMAESAAPEAAAGSGSAGAAGGNRHSGSHAAAFTTTSTGSRGEISHTITADLSDLFAVGGRRGGAGCLLGSRARCAWRDAEGPLCRSPCSCGCGAVCVPSSQAHQEPATQLLVCVQISRQMDAQFERRHREVPHLVYGAIFDCNWRSLSPAKLQVGRRCGHAASQRQHGTAQHSMGTAQLGGRHDMSQH